MAIRSDRPICRHLPLAFKSTIIGNITLQWRHNERDGVSTHRPHDCLLNRSFRRRLLLLIIINLILLYSDIIVGPMASQITSLTIVYSTVYSGADHRKHQSSASLAFVRGIHRWPVNSPQMASNAGNVSTWWRHQHAIWTCWGLMKETTV